MPIEVSPDTTDKVITALKELASHLGTTVEKLWPVLVQQQKIVGLVDLTMLIVLFLTPIIVLLFIKKYDWADSRREPTKYGVIGTACCILIGLCVLLGVIGMSDMISHIINPEYWALRDIANMLR